VMMATSLSLVSCTRSLMRATLFLGMDGYADFAETAPASITKRAMRSR
jgi:hypothetical protein